MLTADEFIFFPPYGNKIIFVIKAWKYPRLLTGVAAIGIIRFIVNPVSLPIYLKKNFDSSAWFR